jgi:hypothetical protein
MSIKDRYTVKRIEYRLAMDIVIEHHYLHRVCPVSHSFGLFEGDEVIGVITYGVPCSSTLLKGIAGDEEKQNVYELNRLWVKDGTPKNTESFFIAQSMKDLDREIIVSFAEIRMGHRGIVYQASNFLYCGLSKKFRDPKVKGMEHMHHATYANRMTMAEVREKYGAENVYYVDRPRKHRYIYINAFSKRRRKELRKKLKYKVLPYPKEDYNVED